MKTPGIVRAEESLREFIVDEIRMDSMRLSQDARDDAERDAYKYRGLTLIVNSSARDSIPQFAVQIGPFEAMFSIETGKKIDGGMPSNDIHLIEAWLRNSLNKKLMMDVWTGSYEEKFVKLCPFDGM